MGPQEILLIVAIGALLFGPKLIPNVSNALGRATKTMKAGYKESKAEEWSSVLQVSFAL